MAPTRPTKVTAARTLMTRSAHLPMQIVFNVLFAPILLARWKSTHATASRTTR